MSQNAVPTRVERDLANAGLNALGDTAAQRTGGVNCTMIGHERFGVRFLNTTTKAKFYVQNAFCYTSDWILKMSRVLRFRVAVDAKAQCMRVAERTLNIVECIVEGCETFG